MQNTSNGMSTAALVLSIVGVLTMCCGGSVILGSLAILLALLSRGTQPMNGQAKAAVGISIAGVILGIIVMISLFAYVLTDPDANSIYRDYMQYYYDELEDEYPYSDYYGDYYDDDYYDDDYPDYNGDDFLRYYEEAPDYFHDNSDSDGYVRSIPHQTPHHPGETIL